MPAFIITGSTIMPATRPGFSSSTRATAAASLKPTTATRSTIALGDAGVARDRDRPVRRAGLVGLGEDRDLHRVVVAVVAALDLDDEVAAGGGAHEVHRVHRGLGARVAEPPERQAEPSRELLRDDDGVLGRLREVGAARDPLADRTHDRRVRVTHQRDAVAAVQVDVLRPVDVVDLGARAVGQPDRLRLGDLPVRRRPAGERPAGPGDELGGPWLPAQEDRLLLGDPGVQPGVQELRGRWRW